MSAAASGPASVCFSSARHRVPAVAVLQEEVLQRAAAPAQKLHYIQQPGAVWGRRAGRVLLGLQHHADQGLEDGLAGGREARRPPAPRLHRLLCQQGQQTVQLLGQLPGENERQRSLTQINKEWHKYNIKSIWNISFSCWPAETLISLDVYIMCLILQFG